MKEFWDEVRRDVQLVVVTKFVPLGFYLNGHNMLNFVDHCKTKRTTWGIRLSIAQCFDEMSLYLESRKKYHTFKDK